MEVSVSMSPMGQYHTDEFLKLIGVSRVPRSTSVFDPGYDLITLEGHLEQSSHLMSILKISMACWLIADEDVTRRKIAAATDWNVPTVTGGGQRHIGKPLATFDSGHTYFECGQGSTDMPLVASKVVVLAE